MKYGAAIMNDQTPILLLNWAILPPKLERTLMMVLLASFSRIENLSLGDGCSLWKKVRIPHLELSSGYKR